MAMVALPNGTKPDDTNPACPDDGGPQRLSSPACPASSAPDRSPASVVSSINRRILQPPHAASVACRCGACSLRHPREGEDPRPPQPRCLSWVPAFAGMTEWRV
ncbi:hypothetical protein X805_08090 [Sphaerotilus natans subsp. natans DSM 6575]|uniref:Uncharacterized protein n=1 Tax=Sphaerotilus natans subsp. natans DSM 6575 TaxID=1286631 RepID=A0A059KRA3_9BURK|nr:hypothetical protein X805_08090 [Sphaerotilus natans subsp. natans DSM 6575]